MNHHSPARMIHLRASDRLIEHVHCDVPAPELPEIRLKVSRRGPKATGEVESRVCVAFRVGMIGATPQAAPRDLGAGQVVVIKRLTGRLDTTQQDRATSLGAPGNLSQQDDARDDLTAMIAPARTVPFVSNEPAGGCPVLSGLGGRMTLVFGVAMRVIELRYWKEAS